jgi:hypothetical protein
MQMVAIARPGMIEPACCHAVSDARHVCQREVVQGEYQINLRWSVRLTRDQLSGESVDGRHHKKCGGIGNSWS